MSHVPACNLCVRVRPEIIAHCTPSATVIHFQTPHICIIDVVLVNQPDTIDVCIIICNVFKGTNL